VERGLYFRMLKDVIKTEHSKTKESQDHKFPLKILLSTFKVSLYRKVLFLNLLLQGRYTSS